MDKEISAKITATIIDKIPAKMRPVHYLMNLLDIGIDSAYRRLKGDIPYDFEEISKISIDLGFSLDEVIGESKEDKVFFENIINLFDKPQESLKDMLNNHYRFVTNHCNAKESELIVSMNRLLFTQIIGYNNILRFLYYQWACQVSETSTDFHFSNLELSPEIIALCDKIRDHQLHINNQVFIVDPQIILNTINGAQYYYKRELISAEDFSLIKKDFHEYLNLMEKIAQKGVNAVGSKIDIYVSTLNIETNAMYSVCDNRIESYFLFNSLAPIKSSNYQINLINKKWLDSIKKYAVLITGSNEMIQADLFRKARNR